MALPYESVYWKTIRGAYNPSSGRAYLTLKGKTVTINLSDEELTNQGTVKRE